MSILTFHVAHRPAGRPRAEDSRATRLKRIRWAALVLSGAVPVKEAARAHDVSRITIWRWVREALTYDDPEAEALRRELGRTG